MEPREIVGIEIAEEEQKILMIVVEGRDVGHLGLQMISRHLKFAVLPAANDPP